MGILQGSVLSPIFFLFFEAEMLDICQQSKVTVSGLGFVDDTSVLAHRSSTAEIYQQLDFMHKKFMECAKRHGAKFAPEKYELMHMTRLSKHHDMTCTLMVERSQIEVKTDIKVLRVQVDSKLKWGPHINRVKMKIAKQSKALTMLKTSTWRASFVRARNLYTIIVRPAITYVAPVWYKPESVPRHCKRLLKEVQQFQNRCIKVVTGVYKATSIKILKNETRIMPINIFKSNRPKVDGVVIDACRHLKSALRE